MKNQIHPKFLPTNPALFLVAVLLFGSFVSVQGQTSSEVVRILDPYSGMMGVANAHIVQRGESLYKIARQYKITVEELKRLNGLSSNLIHPEDRLAISYPVAEEAKSVAQRAAIPAPQKKATQLASGLPESVRFYQYAGTEADGPFSAAEPLAYASRRSNLTSSNNQAISESRGEYQRDQNLRSLDQPKRTNATKLRSVRQSSSAQTSRAIPASAHKRSINTRKRAEKKTSISQTIYHEVRQGENMYNIAEQYGMSVDELRQASGVPAVLVGQILVIKPSRVPGFQQQKRANENRRVRNRSLSSPNTSEPVNEELIYESAFVSLDVLKQPETSGSLTALRTKKANPSLKGDLESRNSRNTNARNIGRGEMEYASSILPPAARLYSKEAHPLGTTMEQGRYGRYSNVSLKHTKFYAAHKQLPIGSRVNMQIPNNSGYIVVEIVSRLSPSSPYNISLSPACHQILGQGDAPKSVVIYYD